MIEQELKNIWNNSPQSEQISIETSQLIKELNARVNSMQKVIRNRDIREISASVIGMLIYTYLLYEIPFPITKLSCFLSIIWFAYVIFKLRKYKTPQTTNHLDLSVKGQLANQAAAMKNQVVLLDSVAYWYAIPPFIINCVFLLGLGNPSDYNWANILAERILPLSVNFKTATIIGLTFFYAFIIWINKRASAKGVKPILESIEKMQKQINK